MPNIISALSQSEVRDRQQMIDEAQKGTNIMAMLKMYQGLPASHAIGAAVAVLLELSHTHRTEFTRAMRDPVHKDGFTGISVLEVFRRQSQ